MIAKQKPNLSAWNDTPSPDQEISNIDLGQAAKAAMRAIQVASPGRYEFTPARRYLDGNGNARASSTFAWARACNPSAYYMADGDMKRFVLGNGRAVVEKSLARAGWVLDGEWDESPHYSVNLEGYLVVAGWGGRARFVKDGKVQQISLGSGPWRTRYCDRSDSSVRDYADNERPVFWVSFWGGASNG